MENGISGVGFGGRKKGFFGGINIGADMEEAEKILLNLKRPAFGHVAEEDEVEEPQVKSGKDPWKITEKDVLLMKY